MLKSVIKGAEAISLPGNENVVLFIHGLSSSPSEMKMISKTINQEGYTTSAILLSGHGSKPSDLKKITWNDWFNDVKGELFQLRKKYNKIIIVGLSTGASLALHLAAHYQVEGVVALAPAIYLKNRYSKLLPFLKYFTFYSKKKNGPDVSDEKAKAGLVGYEKIPLKAILEAQKLFDHLKNDLPDVYVPALIAHSINDHVIDFKSAEFVYNKISSKSKQFLKLEKSYHILTVDVDKEIVTREVIKFINSICRK